MGHKRGPSDTLEYIRLTLVELRHMAEDEDIEMLSYLIRMAELECQGLPDDDEPGGRNKLI